MLYKTLLFKIMPTSNIYNSQNVIILELVYLTQNWLIWRDCNNK